MLDALRAVGLRHDVRRARERGVDVSALHARDREHVAALVQPRRAFVHRLERVGHGLEDLVLHVDERLPPRVPRGAISAATAASTSPTYAVVSPSATSCRQSLVSVPCVRSPGHVRGGQHGDDAGMGLGPRRVDAQDAGARDGPRSEAPRAASPGATRSPTNGLSPSASSSPS